jgi:hypothetical protein
MFTRGKIIWSPVELDFLKANHETLAMDQICIAIAKSRNAIKNKWAELNGKVKEDKKHVKQGKRIDLGIYVRSAWEANICRWLNHTGEAWMYEPKVFFFEGVKKGTNSYCPDWYLPKLDIWLECKGQMIGPARAAIRRFKKFYPSEFKKLHVITASPNTAASKFFQSLDIPVMAYYNELNRDFRKIIPNWE